jgi:hypothetical protein
MLKTIQQQKLITMTDLKKEKQVLEECILKGYVGCLQYSVYLKYEGMIYIEKYELIQREFFNKTPRFMMQSGFENINELI